MTNRKSNASDPLAVALRLLTGRDRSCVELHQRLTERGFAAEEADETIRRCLDYGYLDDHRFAHNRARALMSSGRAVGRRARLELKKHGLDSALIEQAVAAAEEEFAPAGQLQELLRRRYPDYDDSQADNRMRQRIIGYFQRRGFPLALILDTLKQSDNN